MKKSIVGLVTLGILLAASGLAIVRPTSAFQTSCPLCSTPAQYTCSGRYSLDFPSISAHSSAEMSVTVPGAIQKDEVIVTPAGGGLPEAGLIWEGYVTETTGTVVVRLTNVTNSAIDTAVENYRVTVNHYN